ncbi:MAG: exbD1 [Paucimonas sp.]|jgi:biopolymer transport protein ExbD|nr:exbD1 [Paucimonas sp.]
MESSLQSGNREKDADVMAEMNATPLIDVMLVLLIMLIITIPIQNHAVVLGMQGDIRRLVDASPDVVTIDVDFDGAVLWNGKVMPSRSIWESRLQNIGALPLMAQPEVHLRPNKLVKYKEVAAVLASAQRLGVAKIGVVGSEQFM